ncbi:MAG: SET domain-containing protein-lysine N-methyltransferase [Terriglobales bacterium]
MEALGQLRVAWAAGKARVVAEERFSVGDLVLELEGEVAGAPSRYSVQVGLSLHLVPPRGSDRNPGESHDDRYIWRFLNHSCRPNAWVRGRQLLALRPIAPGEEITFDYNCTEFDMAAPFPCRCGHCGGAMIRGYRHLSPEERRRRLPQLAEHLRSE